MPERPHQVLTLMEKLPRKGIAAEQEIVDEFDRRRIHLPATLHPGDTLSCSVFFPPSPSPRM